MGSKHSKPKKRRSSEASHSQPERQMSWVPGEIFPINCLSVWEEDVFVGKSDGVLKCYNRESRNSPEILIHEKEITDIDIKRSGLYTSSRDRTVCLTDIQLQECKTKLTGHSLVVTALSVADDGRKLVSGSRDCSVKLWDVERAVALKSEMLARNLVTALKLFCEENAIQCSEDKVMKLWDVRTMEVVTTFPMKQYFQTCCDVTNDGMFIVTGSTGANGNGCEVAIWDCRQRKQMHNFKGHAGKVTGSKFLGSKKCVTIGNDCSVRLWDIDSEACVSDVTVGGAKQLTSLALDRENRCYVGTYQSGIQVYKVNSLIKSVEEVNASSLACIEKDRVMYCEFGGGLSKTYLGLPQALRWSALQKHLMTFSC